MKKLLIIFLSALSLTTYAEKKKVAVYVTSPESVEEATRQIVGSELVAAFVANNEYNAVERTSDFLREINKEQTYQHSGNVDDQQISDMGKQFGVDMVCVASIMPFRDEYYINARLINVETATVQATARETSALNKLDEFIQAAENLASKLAGKEAKAKAVEIDSKEYSLVTSGDPYMTPIEIDNTGTYTKAVFKYVTAVPNRIIVSLSSYAQDDNTGKQYPFIGASGIIADQWTELEPGIHTFTVSCEKMPEDLEEVTIYYTSDRYWKLRLTPYGKRNYYRFEDRTEELYNQALNAKRKSEEDAAKKQAEQEHQQEQLAQSAENLAESIAGLVNTFRSYLITVNNYKNSAYALHFGKNVLGVVKGKSSATFNVPFEWYGTLTATQKNGYVLYPTVLTYSVPKQTKRVNLNLNIQ